MNKINEKVKLFKALSDKTRLKIVELLLDGEKCVCEIFPHVDRTQSTVSIHLKKLEEWNILSSKRDGRKIFYRIENDKVEDILKTLDDMGVKEDEN